jgi:hypothetical protein
MEKIVQADKLVKSNGSPLQVGHVIEDEGTPVTQRSNINFTGPGVSVADSGGKTVVTIAGGGGGGGFDYIVDSQATFNNLFDQISPGEYKIKDAYKSVYIKAGLGDVSEALLNLNGYNPNPGGPTSTYHEQRSVEEGAYDIELALLNFADAPSSGMIIRTNNCKYLFCEPGTQLFFNATDGGILVDKPNTQIFNMRCIGNARTDGLSTDYPAGKTLLAPIVYTNYIRANPSTVITGKAWFDLSNVSDCALEYCSVWGVLGVGFRDEAFNPSTADQNLPDQRRNKLENCFTFAIDASTSSSVADHEPTSFMRFRELTNCASFWLGVQCSLAGSTGADFYECANLSNCLAIYSFYASSQDISSNHAYYKCKNVHNCWAAQCGNSVSVSAAYWSSYNSCQNLNNCYGIRNSNQYVDTIINDFNSCDYLDNCHSYQLQAISAYNTINTTVYPFQSCNNLSNCRAQQYGNTLTGSIAGFQSCNRISSTYALSSANIGFGFISCTQVSSSTAENCNKGFESCFELVGCKVISGGGSRGFDSCEDVTGCKVYGAFRAFNTCKYLTGCTAQNSTDTAYIGCQHLSGCRALSGSNGFDSCYYLSSCQAFSNTGDGFASCQYLSSCESTSNTLKGFNGCSYIATSSSSSNGGGNTGNTFVETVTTNPSGL